jgi:hypothetical protein
LTHFERDPEPTWTDLSDLVDDHPTQPGRHIVNDKLLEYATDKRLSLSVRGFEVNPASESVSDSDEQSTSEIPGLSPDSSDISAPDEPPPAATPDHI